MRRSQLARGSGGPASLALSQLRQLYPALAALGIKAGARPTAASVATATMHTPAGAGAGFPHSEDCPVSQRRLPLTSVQDERAFLAKPCPLCLRQRAHHLACEVFCADFERRCAGPRDGSSQAAPEGDLAAEIQKSFRSFVAFEEECVLFATSGMTPSRTWIVYHESKGLGKLSLVNLPGSQLPLAFGLWPLAVVNMTEGVLCGTLAAMEEASVSAAVEYPPWSRAARNPAGRVAAVPAESLRPHAVTSLAAVRQHAARSALSAVDWAFVAQQLRDAKAYFASTDRAAARQARRRETEEAVAREVLQGIKDSGKVVITTKEMEREAGQPVSAPFAASTSTGPTAATPTPAAAPEQTSQTDSTLQTKPTEKEPAATGTAATETAAADREAAPAVTTPAVAGATAAPAAAESAEPTKSQLGDGTWEYRYPNGDVTLVLTDGTQVFRTAAVITTVYMNGNTLYEYANKSSILDRADGVRVTTFPNGSVTEEQLGTKH